MPISLRFWEWGCPYHRNCFSDLVPRSLVTRDLGTRLRLQNIYNDFFNDTVMTTDPCYSSISQVLDRRLLTAFTTLLTALRISITMRGSSTDLILNNYYTLSKVLLYCLMHANQQQVSRQDVFSTSSWVPWRYRFLCLMYFQSFYCITCRYFSWRPEKL